VTDHPQQPEGEPTHASAPQPGHPHHVEVPSDISGIDNLLEEGGPLEPQDIAEVEGEQAPPTADDRAAELTADLQRLQAEFLNYKRRVDRDRELVKQNAVFSVLTPMLDVLDNIDRAREAGELEGGFKGVADQLESVVVGLGLAKFGAPGDPFDPNLHDALSHLGSDPEVSVVTVKHVAKAGYRIGERVVRAAQVLVVDPAEAADGDDN
jgi:molecular chaperone GrpE